jgi:hypothetical protein
MHPRSSPRQVGVVVVRVALLLLFLTASTCHAGSLLNLNFVPGAPVLLGNNGTLAYNVANGDFAGTLTPLTYNAPFVLPHGFALFTGSPQLGIDLTVDQNGNFVSNGAGLTLTGSVTINGATFASSTGNPLLFGAITQFGTQQPAGPAPFDFNGVFTIQGGVLTTTQGSVFGGFPVGRSGGFIIEAENTASGILGNFTQSFSSSTVKSNVGLLVPEPAALTQVLAGAVTLAGWWLARRQGGHRVPPPSPAPPPR